jgi:ribonuclease BN (tRNA processing enzyme)
VATLVLTHLVPAPAPTDADEQPWVDQAAAAFDGTIVVARDLATVTLHEPTG